MTTLIPAAFEVGAGDREPWPQDVKLFQPYEDGQILLPDFASCLSVKAFMRMCHLSYTEDVRSNAEYMSPSGKLPFLNIGKLLIAEFEPIVTFVRSKGYGLSEHLTPKEKLDMKAYMSLISNKLLPAEIYLTWHDSEMFSNITRPRYGFWLPWPINYVVPWRKRNEMTSVLEATGWTQMTLEEVCSEVDKCCATLSERLEDQVYFFGDRPTELDALVYGHFFTLLTTELPFTRFAEIVKGYDNLTEFCKRVDRQFFGKEFTQ